MSGEAPAAPPPPGPGERLLALGATPTQGGTAPLVLPLAPLPPLASLRRSCQRLSAAVNSAEFKSTNTLELPPPSELAPGAVPDRRGGAHSGSSGGLAAAAAARAAAAAAAVDSDRREDDLGESSTVPSNAADIQSVVAGDAAEEPDTMPGTASPTAPPASKADAHLLAAGVPAEAADPAEGRRGGRGGSAGQVAHGDID